MTHPPCQISFEQLSAYADGELQSPQLEATRDALETHVHGCEHCASQLAFLRAMKASTQRVAAEPVPLDARMRILQALNREVERELEQEPSQHNERGSGKDAAPQVTRVPSWLHGFRGPNAANWGWLAAAAALVLWWQGDGLVPSSGRTARNAAVVNSDSTESGSSNGSSQGRLVTAALTGNSLDGLLEELVSLHARPLPSEVATDDQMDRFTTEVGVPVRRPQFPDFDARFDGARLHASRNQRAALLQYTLRRAAEMRGHRVTMYVFDSDRLPLARAASLQERVFRDRPIYVGNMDGFSVGAAERAGVGYAFATDMDVDTASDLILTNLEYR